MKKVTVRVVTFKKKDKAAYLVHLSMNKYQLVIKFSEMI